MWTKQQLSYCSTCGTSTNKVTHYRKDDSTGSLTAEVRCAQHVEPAVCNEHQSAPANAAEPAA